MSDDSPLCTVARIIPDSTLRVVKQAIVKTAIDDPWVSYRTDRKNGQLLCTWPKNRREIFDKQLEMLGKAKKTAFFSSFIFDNENIVEELIQCHERLKGHVYVLSGLDKHELKRKRGYSELIPDNMWKRIDELATHGIEVRKFDFCHAKYLLIDNQELLVTSANATDNSYFKTPELGYWSNDPEEAERLGQFFKHTWRFASQKRYRSKGQGTLDPIPESSIDPLKVSSSADDGLIWTYSGPYSGEKVETHIIDIINSARKGETVNISTWSMDTLEDTELGKKIVETTHKGINVNLIVQEHLFNSRRERFAMTWLQENADSNYLEIRLNTRTHAKLAANSRKSLIWSGNLDPEKGLCKGYEIGWKSTEKWFIESINAFFNALWQTSEYEVISGGIRGGDPASLQETHIKVIIDSFKEPIRRADISLVGIIDMLEESQVYTRTSFHNETLIGCGGLCLALDNRNKLKWVGNRFDPSLKDSEFKYGRIYFIPVS